ncbi:uncharacterized protein ASCRUDRAFT_8856 [Ascoidea rubescens DSM 1968]|uniref:Calponin-homology (CH) domain-containing protein n=1 Tax=Ascoidea rubescens DSM 1968 TaxID=1344418 RepID=A0A1D2VEM6_9ASCO|nr:hypothetical protein ASCRUDRAFT_8856 [Ascoidea rubescens DSM 1968]ODV60086.1 hypothetical protein ASCRUDRAFT_8856 [Ascoidea rubescens DSM 1968]
MSNKKFNSSNLNWINTQYKVFIRWINNQFQQTDDPIIVNLIKTNPSLIFVKNLSKDLCNGVKLIFLLKTLYINNFAIDKPTHTPLNQKFRIIHPIHLKPIHKLHSIENLNLFFDFLKFNDKIFLNNISAEDILEGNLKLILALIWILISNFTLNFSSSDLDKYENNVIKNRDNTTITNSNKLKTIINEKKFLLKWCQRIISHNTLYTKKVNSIDNFSTNWNNGLIFCAILHYFRPELINFGDLNPKNIEENINLFLSVTTNVLKIPKLIDLDDINNKNPDEKSIIIYIASLYRYFNKSKLTNTLNNNYKYKDNFDSSLLKLFLVKSIEIIELEKKYEENVKKLNNNIDDQIKIWNSTNFREYEEFLKQFTINQNNNNNNNKSIVYNKYEKLIENFNEIKILKEVEFDRIYLNDKKRDLANLSFQLFSNIDEIRFKLKAFQFINKHTSVNYYQTQNNFQKFQIKNKWQLLIKEQIDYNSKVKEILAKYQNLIIINYLENLYDMNLKFKKLNDNVTDNLNNINNLQLILNKFKNFLAILDKSLKPFNGILKQMKKKIIEKAYYPNLKLNKCNEMIKFRFNDLYEYENLKHYSKLTITYLNKNITFIKETLSPSKCISLANVEDDFSKFSEINGTTKKRLSDLALRQILEEEYESTNKRLLEASKGYSGNLSPSSKAQDEEAEEAQFDFGRYIDFFGIRTRAHLYT